MNFDPDPTGSDAFAETIGGLFDGADIDLDNQMAEIGSISESKGTGRQQTDTESSDIGSDFGDLF